MRVSGSNRPGLRARLLKLAEREIERGGYEALSLRDMADTLGVSAPAIYRHFDNKLDLLIELAKMNLTQLGQRYREAQERGKDPAERLRLACQAHLDFAKARPEAFRLIFNSNITWYPGAREEIEKPEAPFRIMERLVADCRHTQNEEQGLVATLAVWSIIHGFAALRLSGRLASFLPPSIIEAAEQAIIAEASSSASIGGDREDC